MADITVFCLAYSFFGLLSKRLHLPSAPAGRILFRRLPMRRGIHADPRALSRERLRTVTCYTFLFFSLAILRA